MATGSRNGSALLVLPFFAVLAGARGAHAVCGADRGLATTIFGSLFIATFSTLPPATADVGPKARGGR
jgi:hypothetical protein